MSAELVRDEVACGRGDPGQITTNQSEPMIIGKAFVKVNANIGTWR